MSGYPEPVGPCPVFPSLINERLADVENYSADHTGILSDAGRYVRPPGGVPAPEPPAEWHGPLDHCLKPACLRHQLRTSLYSIGVESIDVYYLHNPEVQYADLSSGEFGNVMALAFATLEEAVSNGYIWAYGIATWNIAAWKVADSNVDTWSIERLKELAADVASRKDHFRFVQAPLSFFRREALIPCYQYRDSRVSLTELCAHLGMGFVASASAGSGKVPTLAAASVQWVTRIPGVSTALMGTLNVDHLMDALATMHDSAEDL
jgi:aryl-alcohol dehydrogenase-like predicted oxidoreductase